MCRINGLSPDADGATSTQSFELGDLLRRQLGKVEVALGITGEPMGTVDGATATADQFSVRAEQADARDLVGHEHHVAVVHPDLHRMIEVAPFGEESAIAVEHLDAVVLAIADQHLAAAIDPDGVRRREGPRPGAGTTPGGEQRAVGGKPMDPGSAVTVGDVDLAVR